VERWLRARTAAKAASENMATTPKSGKAHAGVALDVLPGVTATALASYMRMGAAVVHGLARAGTGTGAGSGTTGTTGAQGLPSVGAGVGAGVGGGTYGVVVTVVGM